MALEQGQARYNAPHRRRLLSIRLLIIIAVLGADALLKACLCINGGWGSITALVVLSSSGKALLRGGVAKIPDKATRDADSVVRN